MSNQIRSLLQKGHNLLRGGPMARGSVGSLILQLSNTGLVFLIALLLTSQMTAQGYGIFVFSMAWVNLLIMPSALGLNDLVIPQMASYRERSEWALMRGLLVRSTQGVILTAIILAAAAYWILRISYAKFTTDLEFPLQIALGFLPFWTLALFLGGTLRGLGLIIKSQIPLLLIRAIFFISAILLLASMFHLEITAERALLLNGLAILVAIAYAIYTTMKYLPHEVRQTPPVFQTRNWIFLAMPFFIFSVLRVTGKQADVLMLGLLLNPESAGIFSIARRGAELLYIPVLAIGAVLGPRIALFSAKKNREELQRLIFKSSRAMIAVSLIIGIILLIFGQLFLGLFGDEYLAGRYAMNILVVGTLLFIAAGPVGLILLMTGHGREAAIGMGIWAVTSIVLNFLLIPRAQLEGAALATSISQILMVSYMMVKVRQKLNISSLPIRFWSEK